MNLTPEDLAELRAVLGAALDRWLESKSSGAAIPAADRPPPANPLQLPSVVMPPEVFVDPLATVARIPIALSEAPSTTAIVVVATMNGDGDHLAWEGGQYLPIRELVVLQSGGSPLQVVDVPLRPSPENDGRHFFLMMPRAENPGTAPGACRTKVTFKAGAAEGQFRVTPPILRLPRREKLTYSLDVGQFRASDSGGPGIWRTRFHHGRTQPGNGEIGFYTDPDLHPGTRSWRTEGGELIMRAEKFPGGQRVFGQHAAEYGASVLQAAWLAQQYGTYDALAMTSSARGSWSAFWLLASDGSWPPEIDVFEHPRNGEVERGHTTAAMHWGPSSEDHHSIGAHLPIDSLWKKPIDFTAEFHRYTVDWRRDFTTYFIDDIEIWRTPTMFHKPAFPLLDVAVGGWAGTPDFSSGTTEMRVRELNIYE